MLESPCRNRGTPQWGKALSPRTTKKQQADRHRLIHVARQKHAHRARHDTQELEGCSSWVFGSFSHAKFAFQPCITATSDAKMPTYVNIIHTSSLSTTSNDIPEPPAPTATHVFGGFGFKMVGQRLTRIRMGPARDFVCRFGYNGWRKTDAENSDGCGPRLCLEIFEVFAARST